MSLKRFDEHLLLKWSYLAKAGDKVNGDVITPTLQLKFSNGADTKPCYSKLAEQLLQDGA